MGFISIQEAAERTGKSLPTITRLARSNENTKHVQRKDRKFFIEEAFLFSQYSEVTNHDSSRLVIDESVINHDESPAPEEKKTDHSLKLIERLEDENNFLKRQIEKKDQQITHFQERQKELHYLLNHQTKLLESVREAEPAPAGDQSRTGPDETKKDTHKKAANSNSFNNAFAIWIALAAISVILLLAILFRDPLRAWLDS